MASLSSRPLILFLTPVLVLVPVLPSHMYASIHEVSMLGAAAGLARLLSTQGELKNSGMLSREDKSLLADVAQFLEGEEEVDKENKEDHLDWCSSGLKQPEASRLTCFIDLAHGFVKKEILHENEPQVFLIHEAFTESELGEILTSVRASKELVHLYSLYKDYISSLPVQSRPFDEVRLSNFSSADWQMLATSQKLGREGKVFFPGPDSSEARLIEGKLRRLKLVGEGEAALQVATYGVGGWLAPHFDTYRLPGEEKQGEDEEWVGTVMGYLTSVEQGGHTVFPRLDLKVAPVAGSLIGWQTIGSRGQVLEDSLHLGCPVVHGEKWVFNKWVIQ